MTTTDPITDIGVVITALGVIAAVLTILDARRTAMKQKNLETLLRLANHLTE